MVNISIEIYKYFFFVLKMKILSSNCIMHAIPKNLDILT